MYVLRGTKAKWFVKINVKTKQIFQVQDMVDLIVDALHVVKRLIVMIKDATTAVIEH